LGPGALFNKDENMKNSVVSLNFAGIAKSGKTGHLSRPASRCQC